MKSLLIFSVLLFAISCQNVQRPAASLVTAPDDELTGLDISGQAIEEVIAQASPVDMAVVVKSTGVRFSEKYLYDLNRLGSSMPAYFLGMLNSDLGFLNTYEKTSSYVDYISAMSRLSDMIKLQGFFRFEEMKKIASGSKDYEQLSFLSLESFNRMDEHLIENKRTDISIPLLAGVWLESMYHAIMAAEESDDTLLTDVIGEQKSTLANLIILLTDFGKDISPEMISDFESIKKVFDEVTVIYTISPPKSSEQNGILTVTQQESSVVEISRGTLNRIIKKIKEVRNKQITS